MFSINQTWARNDVQLLFANVIKYFRSANFTIYKLSHCSTYVTKQSQSVRTEYLTLRRVSKARV
jgi:hypothetical protein